MMADFENLRIRVWGMYDPHSYYCQKYYPEEKGYWGNIPQWMKEEIRRGDKTIDIGPGYGGLAAWASFLDSSLTLTLDRVNYMSDTVQQAFKLLRMTNFDVERSIAKFDPDRSSNKFEYLDDFNIQFDHVIMTEVLEHFNFNPVPTLLGIRQTMMPSGKLYLSTPLAGEGWHRMKMPVNCPSVLGPIDMPSYDHATMSYDSPKWFDGHVWHYNTTEVNDLLARCGFRVLKTGTSRSSGGAHQQYLACVAL